VGVGAISQRWAFGVFLDRDGTLIETTIEDGVPRAATALETVEILPGVRESLRQLRRAGLALAMVTNQPDVARGTLQREVVEQINAYVAAELAIDAVACCYHDDVDSCACRKPRPGMLVDAAARLGVPLLGSFVIGDRWRDIKAGQRAGCTTILLRNAYSGDQVQADYEADNFGRAAEIILRCLEERR